jgi:hypothetical protein
MKISRKPTPPPRATAPSRPSRLVTADTAFAPCQDLGNGPRRKRTEGKTANAIARDLNKDAGGAAGRKLRSARC